MHHDDPWDLTYVFITAGFDYRITMAIFFILTFIRYSITAYLLYVYIVFIPDKWEYTLVFLIPRILFVIIVLKVSLK